MHGVVPRFPIDLVSLPIDSRPVEFAETFAKHIHDIHAGVQQKIAQSNENYKLAANVHRRKLEFNDGDYVMVRICPERFPKYSFRKLFARVCGPYRILKRLGSNAYLIDLPSDLSISPIFNFEDLTLYRDTFAPPTFSASVTGASAISSVSISQLPPAKPSVVDEVEVILEDEIVSTSTGGFQ